MENVYVLGVDKGLEAEGRLERLVHEHEVKLARYLRRFVDDRETALDLTQDVFLAAWRMLKADPRRPLTAGWLYKTATNNAISLLRRQKRRGQTLPLGDAGSSFRLDERSAESLDLQRALALLPEVRRALHDLAPDQPLIDPMTQQEQFEEGFLPERIFARLATAFALLAALMVAAGLYGTLAYGAGRRTAEIGVRMALGAERWQIAWMVLRESLVVSAAGILVGLPLAIAAARLLRSLLFGVGPADPLTLAGVTAGITLVALAAGYVPARRASKVDPMVALRHE